MDPKMAINSSSSVRWFISQNDKLMNLLLMNVQDCTFKASYKYLTYSTHFTNHADPVAACRTPGIPRGAKV